MQSAPHDHEVSNENIPTVTIARRVCYYKLQRVGKPRQIDLSVTEDDSVVFDQLIATF